MRESNSHQRFWRPLSYHLTNPLYTRKSGCWPQILLHCTLKTTYMLVDRQSNSLNQFLTCVSWSSPHPISNSQLHVLPHFHLCPIYLVLFKGFYSFKRMGYLILGGTSRLDAFSVYSFRTWLPGHGFGKPTGPPAVRPSRSSRTKDSSSQISYAHAG